MGLDDLQKVLGNFTHKQHIHVPGVCFDLPAEQWQFRCEFRTSSNQSAVS